jgi:hypothetical protein
MLREASRVMRARERSRPRAKDQKHCVQELSEGNSSLASQSIPTWNRIIDWLKQIETLGQLAA